MLPSCAEAGLRVWRTVQEVHVGIDIDDGSELEQHWYALV